MSGQVWEVVGGADKGGIVVREGKDLKSKELERLATGSLIRQVELVGERLSFQRLTGGGPEAGWVSLQVKGTELVVKTDKEPPPPPVIVCFYSGGMTAPQGRSQLRYALNALKKGGLPDSVVMDHIGEEGFEDCKDFDEYTARLAAVLEADPKHAGRPVFILAHSHGTVPAWGLAKRLGGRCLKLYVLTRRPPNGALLDETWGVSAAPALADVGEDDLLEKMLVAWPNKFLEGFRGQKPLPKPALDVMAVVKRQYSSPVYPCGSADAGTICGEGQAIPSPIMGLAAELEAEKGETASKMEGWGDFTAGGFELVTVPGVDHMGIMAMNSSAFATILADMKKVMP